MSGSDADVTAPVITRLARGVTQAAGNLGMGGSDATFELARRLGISGILGRLETRRLSPPEDAERELLLRLCERLYLDAAQEISESLAKLMVPHFFARGIALLGRVYQPGERLLSDIDLYVHPTAAKLTEGALNDLGFHELPSDEQSGPSALRPGVAMARGNAGVEVDAIALDVHWGIEPLSHLLPRVDTPIPEEIWRDVSDDGSLPVPSIGRHSALILHHLVHHDMLHVRGLVDLALLWGDIPRAQVQSLVETARTLGVSRALRALNAMMARDLGLGRLAGVGPPPSDWRGKRLQHALVLHRWLAWAASGPEGERVEVTPRRIARRFLLLDTTAHLPALIRDIVLPPRAHLRWRWPDAQSDLGAWVCHTRSVAKKAVQR